MSGHPPRVLGVSTALYRRYRPETFADVIGQEHVTEPLMQALRTGRVNHAYLFSGPRGCGKTTSARILARCLNCEQGPTPTPCGTCESCIALSRNGSGTVDVIEIDAASHGGVDDARDLRERASYGPAQSRYKIYIIDEAHMVTSQGFNALLKIVEEPPEHVKFIFATTEPEKVIGTIRSRTHHYPFRLVPPQRLADYMEQLCASEGVAVEPGVLSFVTRAGGGSVRDSLSVLDQLIAGSGEDGVTYAGAAALLGFTDGALLDATVDALAAGDGASVFQQIDKVVESGHDPRRFVEDLLERLRDLIVVAAVRDGAAAVLRGVPEDQLDRMRTQAGAFGPGELSRAADIANTGLTEMTGATSPRLQLELICARILLPAASGEHGYAARLDRVERRLDISDRSQSTSAPARTQPDPARQPQQPQPDHSQPAQPPSPQRESRPPAAQEPTGTEPAASQEQRPSAPDRPEPSPDTAVAPSGGPRDMPGPEPVTDEPVAPVPTRGGLGVDELRREWPQILERIGRIRKVTWSLLSQHAHVVAFDGQVLTLGASSAGLAERISTDPNPEVIRQAVNEALGLDVRVAARSGDGPAPAQQPEQSSSGWGESSRAQAAPQERSAEATPRQGGWRDRVGMPNGVRSSADSPAARSGPSAPDDTDGDPVPARAEQGGGSDQAGRGADAAGRGSNEVGRGADVAPAWTEAPATDAPAWARETSPDPREASLNPRETSPNPRETSLNPREASPNPRETSPDPRETPPARSDRQTPPAAAPEHSAYGEGPDEEGSLDDETVDDLGAVGLPVLSEVLGAQVIDDRRE
ncbi:DNA polymerase III subunit gamma and tau [Calidifontibacter sp. DB0510]|uniref:DNA polymerase III subunit gamma/tau n=1 Tax=Metallococcus carri TaxID=1656884 RepID=A0A967EHQ1_9MICO|nr:DNA polymerase III subunit gamma and tau [Metallococcus carri]NHN56778.1 DNA polymerase III subunit gamma and tau [Metallococcus carri]NOP37845.1 DNA polymerase III subunit gamma and tau [Calidifontibacter sp. DB2511S]